MSPAVMDFRSPLTSSSQIHQNAPSIQNPSPYCANRQFQQSRSPSNTDSNPTSGFNPGNVSFGGFDCSFPVARELVKSKFSGRSKPRLVKLRKKSGSESSNWVNDTANATSTNTTSGSSCSASGVKCGNHVNNSGFGFDSNSKQMESNGKVGHSAAAEFWNPDFSFVCGVSKRGWAQNSEAQGGQCGENEEQSGAVQLGKANYVGFVFGDSRSSFASNLSLQQTESSGSVERSGGNEPRKANNADFVSGNNECRLASNLNSKYEDSNVTQEQFGADEFGKFYSKSFVFAENKFGFASNSNLEKEKFHESVRELGPNNFEKVDNLGFISSANKNDSVSNSILENSKTLNVENLGPSVNSLFGSNESNLNSVSNESVFGNNHGYSLSNSNVGKNGSGESFGKSDPVELGEMKSDCDNRSKVNMDAEKDPQKAKDNDLFVFESVCKKSSSFNGSSNFIEGRNKLNNGIPGNCNGFIERQNDYVCSDFRDSSNLVFGSTSNIAGPSGKSHLNNLSDDMNALNINDFENINGANKMECPNSSSFTNAKNVFVFGSNNKTSTSLIGSANGGAVHDGGKAHIGAHTEKAFAYVSNEEIAGSFEGTMKNMMSDEMRNMSASFKAEASCEQTNSWCSVNFGKKSQPVNFSEKSSDEGKLPRDQPNNDSEFKKAVFPPSFSTVGLGFQPNDGVSEAPSMGRFEKEEDFSFKDMPFGQQTSFTDFGASNLNAFSSLKVNLFPILDKKLEFSSSNRSTRDRRLKKKFGKFRRQTVYQQFKQGHLSKNDSSQLNQEPSVCGSPMDFSPYPDKNCVPSTAHLAVSNETKHGDLTSLRRGPDIIEGEKKSGGPDDEDSWNCSGSYSVSDRQLEESAPGPGIEYMNSKAEQDSVNCPPGIISHIENEERDGKTHISAASTSEKFGGESVTSTILTPEQDRLLAIRRQYRKKYRLKVGRGSDHTAPSQKIDFVTSSADEHTKKTPTEGSAWEACDKWRIRGNQAYKNGNLSQAEDLYTEGITSIQHTEMSGCCIEPLVLCYSNRAATRMSLGRMREALDDCAKAASLDPNFLKVQIRAANCHLVLGEVEYALECFNKCLESGNVVCLDRRITIEAADGLQKAQKVLGCRNQSVELLQQRTSDAANTALGLIADALSISCYSEKLFKLKGEALCLLRKYEEAIQLCEQTIGFAEKNFTVVGTDNHLEHVNNSEHKNSSIKLWRWCLMSKAYYYLGKLEMALDVIEKQEDLRSTEDKCQNMTRELPFSLAVTVRELLQHKKEGNEAFQSGRHTEAIEHYSAAISSGIESHPFAAICFCNRAAAHQALGQIADAIADCSIAIVLDENYSKAVSRRAILHETIRDYEQAANDLRRLISLLESQSQKKAQPSETKEGLTGSGLKDLNWARRRLSSVEEKAKKGIPLDLYIILGIKASDTAAEIKKAYRKAALRHHPDKAGQFLARSDSGDNGQLWKEIVEEVHKDADRLFKMIGEAYAILSDPAKRSDYDLEEEMRNNRTNGSRSSNSERQDDYCTSPFARSRSSGRSSSFYTSPFGSSSSNRRY